MVIDNKPVIDNDDTKFEEEKISSVVTKVQVLADDAAKIVADNIVAVKDLAANISNIIQKTNEFNKNSQKLLEEKYDSKSGLDVLAEANKTYTNDLINKIKLLSGLQTELLTLGNISKQIEQLALISDVLDEINDNIVTIREVGALNAQISVVDGIAEDIKKVVLFNTELIRIDDALQELLTIFNYLPQLLVLHGVAQDYVTLRDNNGFTDQEAYEAIKAIVDNITTILAVSNSLTDIKALKDTLDKAPDLLQNIKDELQSLTTNYSAQLNDQFNKHKKDLAEFVADTKIKISDMMLHMGEVIANLKCCCCDGNGGGDGGNTGGTGLTLSQVFNAIKAGNNITIDRATNSITINATVNGGVTDPNVVTEVTAGDNIFVDRVDNNVTVSTYTLEQGNNITLTKNDKVITIEANVPTVNQGEILAGDNVFVEKNGDDTTISTYTLKAGKDITLDIVDKEITISSSGNITPNIPIEGIDNLTGGING